jgi:hypothetical protein
MSLLAVFIEWPGLALVPAVPFFLLYRGSRRRLVASAVWAWLLYAAYEYGMKRRWLCTGECNIRVDLLLLYPALLGVSGAAAVSGLRALKRRTAPGNP